MISDIACVIIQAVEQQLGPLINFHMAVIYQSYLNFSAFLLWPIIIITITCIYGLIIIYNFSVIIKSGLGILIFMVLEFPYGTSWLYKSDHANSEQINLSIV